MDRRVTPPKGVTSPTWGPPLPCKQALSRTKQRCSRVKQLQGKDKKACCTCQICFLLIRRKSVLHVQFVFLLIRSICLEAIHCRPRLALHDLIFFLFTR